MDKLLPWYYKQLKPFGAYDIFNPNELNTYVCSVCSKEYAELIINSVNRPPQQRCAVEWPEKKKLPHPPETFEKIEDNERFTIANLNNAKKMMDNAPFIIEVETWNRAIDLCKAAYNAVHGSEREGEK